MTEDQVKDLTGRLIEAAQELEGIARNLTSDRDVSRLCGKAQGVRLALSYLKEYQ